MTAYKKIYLTIILVITITLLASAGMFFYKSLVKNLRQEITADLRKEIKKLVALELKQHTAGTGEIPQQGQERQNLARDLRPGIRELLKQELWSYEAGGEAKGGVAQEEDVTQEKGIAQIIQPDISAGKPKDKALERALIEKGGMLLAKGQLQIEPSFTTAHFSSHRINIQGFAILPVLIIGNITTETIKRDIFIEALSLKYGLWKNLQVEAKVPYKYQFDRVTDNVGAETTRSDSGIGDIELGLSRQIA